MQNVSQASFIMEYFKSNPHREIPHPEIVDAVSKEYEEKTGNKFRDPDRAIRQLHQKGFLIKVKKGVYKYDPDLVQQVKLEDFTPAQKEIILKRDGYKCVICGKGIAEGVELHVDHIKPKDLGGEAIIENGQTLCAQHNFNKKNLKQTETGKKMFIRLYELAKIKNEAELLKFTEEILEVYERNNMNGHIVWKK